MISPDPRRPTDDEKPLPPAPQRSPTTPPRREPKHDELDLDLEEADDGDRLKEGFTGQER